MLFIAPGAEAGSRPAPRLASAARYSTRNRAPIKRWLQACLVLLLNSLSDRRDDTISSTVSRKTKTLSILCAVLVVGATIIIFAIAILQPNRVVIRNDSDSDLHHVELTLRDSQGQLVLSRSVPTLSPGESISFRHSANDPSADLRFTLAGQVHSHHEAFDLWRGEGWLLAIDSSGRLSSTYESAGSARGSD